MKREAHNGSLEYNGQAAADKFVLNCTNFKRNGYFLELGSRHFKNNNNSYILEKTFNWKGVMVEYDRSHLTDYKTHRSNSIHIMEDARLIDYRKIFEENDFPVDLDFWQLDLYTSDNSAYETLTKINEEILNDYKFATITFEHDFFSGIENSINTRTKSREILKERGYLCVFEDIIDPPELQVPVWPYEDWWVHPELVDMSYIKSLKQKNENKYFSEAKSAYPKRPPIGTFKEAGWVPTEECPRCFKAYKIEY